MSSDNPDGPENPFFPDEELGSELDAWDSTFDALHGESEEPAGRGEETGVAQRAPALVPVTSASADDFADSPTPEGGSAYQDPVPLPGQEIPRAQPTAAVAAPVAPKRTRPAIIRRTVPAASAKAPPPRVPLSDTKPLPMSGEPPSDAVALGTQPSRRAQRETVPAPYPLGENDAPLADPGQSLAHRVHGPSALGGAALALDDDDYADMEIDASVSSDPAVPVADVGTALATPPRRKVAHVVRRASVPTQAPERKSETIPTIAAPARDGATTADESDFSDLSDAPTGHELARAEMDQGDEEDDFITEPARPRRNVDPVDRVSDSQIIALDDDAVEVDQDIDPPGEERGTPEHGASSGDTRRLRDHVARGDGVGAIDFSAMRFPEQVQPLSSAQFDEQLAQTSLFYERELALVDQPELHLELGRLREHFGELDRARWHYEAALRADPNARSALRGLRRIAWADGDIPHAIQHLEAEIALSGPLERSALDDHRIDLLLAAGVHDQARTAVSDALARTPRHIRALLSAVELALTNGDADEVSSALERLADAVTDPGLRSALHAARGTVASYDRDHGAAIAWFATAAQADPSSFVPRLAMAQHLAAQENHEATAEMAVRLGRYLESADPVAAAALAIRGVYWSANVREDGCALAASAMPNDALVTRVVAESAVASGDPAVATAALTAWARSSAPPAEREYAASRAAEFDPDKGADLWRIALGIDPGDDYVAAQLRTTLVATANVATAIDVDLQVAANSARQRAQLRAGFGLMAEGKFDEALNILLRSHRDHPTSLAVAEALAEGYAAAGRWTERAQLLAELAQRSGDSMDRDGAQLRSALAWEEAVGAEAAAAPPDAAELRRFIETALDAWGRILAASDGTVPAAHAASIVLATRLGDSRVLDQVLARAQKAEASPWSRASLALRRARPLMRDSATALEAETILRDGLAVGADSTGAAAGEVSHPDADDAKMMTQIEDPRRSLWLMVSAARRRELGDAATALEHRAETVGATPEATVLRLRAAQLALDAGDAARAATLLVHVQSALPTLPAIAELVAVARRKAGDPAPVQPKQTISARTDEPGEAFAHLIRDAEAAAEQGESTTAIALFQRALELRPGDPMASSPLVRVARQIGDVTTLSAAAEAQLGAAERTGNAAAIADAHGQLALVDAELRKDTASAQSRLESAVRADPTRLDLLHRLQTNLSVTDRVGELVALRRAELEQLPLDLAADRASILMDIAGLAERDRRSEVELAPLYRDVLAADPRHRLALFLLESLVRRAGSSSELAQLEERVARHYEGDPRAQAAFYTRAGETLAEIDQIDAAVQKFGMADEVLPGHVPALTAWRATAMKGQLWIDVAQAVTRLAATASDPSRCASLHHFAGVALMDKALVGDRAVSAFRKALEADPRHKDAFVRLRIVLEEEAAHDELAVVLRNRLQVESQPSAKLEIHRALAELHRNFLDSRDIAKSHYREILTVEPNDLRALAAVGDIAWEQGNWQEAADALIARAKLERDPATLSTLCYRLGLLYADRLSDPAMALRAFQRGLTYQPDDVNTLIRLVDLASVAGEWQLALGACERLVTIEQDPEERVAHLHRVAKVFRLGFGDAKRAERALNMALDGAPTNDEALTQLVQFYREAGDLTSVRVHLNRVIGVMRSRVAASSGDGVAYRVISRAMAARDGAGLAGSLPVARVAAELATLFGAAAEPEHQLVANLPRVDLKLFAGSEADDAVFPRSIQSELRQMFRALDDRVAKHVGIDLDMYGVSRGNRLRASDSSVAGHAQDIATALGCGEIDIYISSRTPFAMVAEPTTPVSLVIGQRIADAGDKAVRFAAGSALKLAQAGLAIPARLAPDDLGQLVVALLRCFQPEFPSQGLDDEDIAAQVHKLRRLLSTSLLNELRPLALAIDGSRFSHQQLATDLQAAGQRSGLIASGSITAGLAILAARRGLEVLAYISDPEAQQLIQFAISDDHASVAR